MQSSGGEGGHMSPRTVKEFRVSRWFRWWEARQEAGVPHCGLSPEGTGEP